MVARDVAINPRRTARSMRAAHFGRAVPLAAPLVAQAGALYERRDH